MFPIRYCLLKGKDSYMDHKKSIREYGCYWCALLSILVISSCTRNYQGLRFINTGYSFEHIREYQPDRYFSKEELTYDDYLSIVSKYTRKFGEPMSYGTREDAMINYSNSDNSELHRVWECATDGEYYTVYEQGSAYLLIVFSQHCGIYLFE